MDINRNIFRDLLYNTYYDSATEEKEIKARMAPIREWIINNIPSKLYRYRSCNSYSISAFENDEIWGSSICKFNDPYECTPYFDVQKAYEATLSEMTPDRVIEFFNDLKENNESAIVKQMFTQEQLDIFRKIAPDFCDREWLENVLCPLKEYLWQSLTQLRTDLIEFYRQRFVELEYRRKIACFSEEFNSTLMWGHYADGHCGFCIEYDFSKDMKECLYDCPSIPDCQNLMVHPTIAPVLYQKKRYNAYAALTPAIEQILASYSNIDVKPIYDDRLAVTKCLLTKSLDWAYEKEWRMFTYVDTDESYQMLMKKTPSAVYIGVRISEENEAIIRRICKIKKIPCYKMAEDFIDDDFSLMPI